MAKRTPALNSAVAADMARMVEEGFNAYLSTYLPGLFPDYTDPAVQDCIITGMAAAFKRHDAAVKCAFSTALALTLLDHETEPAK